MANKYIKRCSISVLIDVENKGERNTEKIKFPLQPIDKYLGQAE